MNYAFRLFVLSLILLPCSAYGQINTDFSSTEFEIYLLKDPLVTTAQAMKVPLDSLELASKPFLSARDIKVYRWSTHEFDLHRRGDSLFQKMSVDRNTSAGVPFVVVVGKQRIYLGVFWWTLLNKYSTGSIYYHVNSSSLFVALPNLSANGFEERSKNP